MASFASARWEESQGDLFFRSSFVDAAFLPYLAIFMFPAFPQLLPTHTPTPPHPPPCKLLFFANIFPPIPSLSRKPSTHLSYSLGKFPLSYPDTVCLQLALTPHPTCQTSSYEFRNFFPFFLCKRLLLAVSLPLVIHTVLLSKFLQWKAQSLLSTFEYQSWEAVRRQVYSCFLPFLCSLYLKRQLRHGEELWTSYFEAILTFRLKLQPPSSRWLTTQLHFSQAISYSLCSVTVQGVNSMLTLELPCWHFVETW